MWKYGILVAVVLCLVVCGELRSEWAEGPPKPVPYKAIPDPPDDAERHIVVKAADRGDVWLMTGFLHGWQPDIEYDVVARVKPKHWREDLMDTRGGSWPLWFPRRVLSGEEDSYWGTQWRGSPVFAAKWLEMILALRGEPMPADAGADGPIRMIAPGAAPLTYQVILGSHFVRKANLKNFNRHSPELVKEYRDFTYMLVKYAKMMGVPVDYWEVYNEPPSTQLPQYFAMWDVAYEAVRAADPDAKMVGPGCGGQHMEIIVPFLDHCKEKGQRMEVLALHEQSQNYANMPPGTPLTAPDKMHWNVERLRKLIDSEYPMLGVEEIHLDEWGENPGIVGPGTQMAFFYYMDLAGVSRSAPVSYGSFLDGLLIGKPAGVYGDSAPSVMSRTIKRFEYTPRNSYWAWVEYAKQEGGVRLVTETNDRCVVMLASRHDEEREIRAVLARSRRDIRYDDPVLFAKFLPPVKVTIDFAGVPISGKAELTILNLGKGNVPMRERELAARTELRFVEITDGAFSLTVDSIAESQVYSIRIAPVGTHASKLSHFLSGQCE